MPSVFRPGVVLNSALDVLFPRLCVRCGRPGAFLCSTCEATAVRIEPPVCPVCGTPRASESLCPSCASHTKSISSIRSVFRLEGVIRRAIHELKYNNLRAIAPTLAAYLTSYVASADYNPDLIVPVPLHSSRQRHRGYNQSELIAAALARGTGISLDSNTLTRRRKTTSQVGSRTAHERLLNVEGAFSCKGDMRGKHILLVDDVCTTGATLESCAVALRREGAVHVWGLTVAREI